MLRSFIAIKLNDKIQNELKHIQENLKKTQADVKWVNFKKIHLTLRFLGNINENQITKIENTLKNIMKNFPAYSLEVRGIGAFPHPENPQIIWAGIGRGKLETEKIVKFLNEDLNQAGFENQEKPFTAHITLGRLRSNKNKNKLTDMLREYEDFSLKFKQNKIEIALIKSELKQSGPIYTDLYKTTLCC